VSSARDEVYRLALGMLWHPADAEHATREILKEALGRGVAPIGERAAFLRIAARHLLERTPNHFERQRWTFETLADDLARGRDEPLPPRAFGTHSLALVEEVKLGCWQSMLLCLDRPDRIAYLFRTLGDMDDRTASAVLELELDEFRARANRAERLVHQFAEENCGLVNRERPCRCNLRLGRALVTGRVDPDELLFANVPTAQAS